MRCPDSDDRIVARPIVNNDHLKVKIIIPFESVETLDGVLPAVPVDKNADDFCRMAARRPYRMFSSAAQNYFSLSRRKRVSSALSGCVALA